MRKEAAFFMNVTTQSNGYKILIIDDDEDLSMIISDMLTDYGYGVTHVTDGNGAFNLLSDNTYHLILLDINLPDADGFPSAGSCGASPPFLCSLPARVPAKLTAWRATTSAATITCQSRIP